MMNELAFFVCRFNIETSEFLKKRNGANKGHICI